MPKESVSKFDKIFPLIQDAIRKFSLSGEWVERDSIVNEIKEDPIVIDCHLEYLQDDNSQISREKWVENEVAFFSKTYTDIRNSIAEDLIKVPEVIKHFAQINNPLKIKIIDWAKKEVELYSPILEKHIKNLETNQKYISEFERRKLKNKEPYAYKIRASRTSENTQTPADIQIAEEIDASEITPLTEGSVTQIFINKYERNGEARIECIKHHGLNCNVCGINFKEIYGEIGEGFIHVHHLIEIHTIGKEYEINPVKDLIPVCPNCHSMLHKSKPPFSVEELKDKINKQRLRSK